GRARRCHPGQGLARPNVPPAAVPRGPAAEPIAKGGHRQSPPGDRAHERRLRRDHFVTGKLRTDRRRAPRSLATHAEEARPRQRRSARPPPPARAGWMSPPPVRSRFLHQRASLPSTSFWSERPLLTRTPAEHQTRAYTLLNRYSVN